MEYVARVHLKTGGTDEAILSRRGELIQKCLMDEKEQYLVIGWCYVYENNANINSFEDFYNAVREDAHSNGKKLDSCLNLFWDAKVGDLFWTRDLEGFYWICRATSTAQAYCDYRLDIGARISVNAYKYGLEVPGQIKAAFSRAQGGVVERIRDKDIVEFSKFVFNKMSGKKMYDIDTQRHGDVLDFLPDFDLEELIISYIQIKENLCVLSNSIANRSTTPLIECEFTSRDPRNNRRAVVQVKGKKGEIDVSAYKPYLDDGFIVYLFSNNYLNRLDDPQCIYIDREDVIEFYNEYKAVLPHSISRWENLFE